MSDTLQTEQSAEHQAAEAQSGGEARDYDAEARAAGWRPKDEFKGEESRWVDAETFVKRGEEWAPYVRANTQRLEEAIKAARQENKELRKTVKDFADHHTKVEQRAYERAVRDLLARQDEAVQAGDVQEVRAITKEMADLAAEAAPGRSTQHPNGWTPDYAEAVEVFQEENPWFQKDKAMTAFAIALDQELAEQGKSYSARFKEIAKQIKEEFPHKFENPNRARAAAVGDGAPAAGRRSGRSFSDLPPDAKAMCDRFIKNGFIKSREDYVKNFQWDN